MSFTVAIVGNGPVRSSHAAAIDEANVVVRINRFKIAGFERLVGRRCTVFGLHPLRGQNKFTDSDVVGCWQDVSAVWIARPLSWAQHLPNLDFCLEFADKKIISAPTDLQFRRWCDEVGCQSTYQLTWSDLEETLRDKSIGRLVGPSTGYTILRMAMETYEGASIRVCGLGEDSFGGLYTGPHSAFSPRHPWQMEMNVIQELAANGLIDLIDA